MLNKTAGQGSDVLGRAWLPEKAYSLGFSARKPPRGKAAPSRRLAFAQIKPTKINLSPFDRLALPEVEDERGAF